MAYPQGCLRSFTRSQSFVSSPHSLPRLELGRQKGRRVLYALLQQEFDSNGPRNYWITSKCDLCIIWYVRTSTRSWSRIDLMNAWKPWLSKLWKSEPLSGVASEQVRSQVARYYQRQEGPPVLSSQEMSLLQTCYVPICCGIPAIWFETALRSQLWKVPFGTEEAGCHSKELFKQVRSFAFAQ